MTPVMVADGGLRSSAFLPIHGDVDHAQAGEMTEPVSLNGHRKNGDAPDGSEAVDRELDRSLIYEILREFRALSAREE
jgi:hypothetical protein